MRTEDEINDEIYRLKDMKPIVRHTTAFGDDNWAAIEAQILVLEKRMDMDSIYAMWPDEDGMHECDSAQEAFAWMNSEEDAQFPSDGWRSLVRK